MPAPTKQRSGKETVTRGATTTTTTTTITAPAAADCGSYLLFYGLNWASWVAAHPFEITDVSSSLASSSTTRATHASRKPGSEKTVREESAALVAAQLPIRSIASSHAALRRAFPPQETQQLPTTARLPAGECHVGTLWCLHPSTSYTVTLRTLSADSTRSTTICLPFATVDFYAPLDLRDEAPHLVERGALLFHPDFVRCITAQGASRLLFYLPPNLLDARTALPDMHALWYHGLFTLPESVQLSPRDRLLFFLLPNGDERYVLDLVNVAAAPASGGGLKVPPAPSHAEGSEKVHRDETQHHHHHHQMFPWRRQSKVRRVIRSGTYTVVVRDDAAGIMASLQRAYEYHVVRHESTWIDPTFIRLMGSTCSPSSGETGFSQSDVVGARLVCVELVDEAKAEIVAGCCGMAIGSVYHDYTMFTLRQCKDSLGCFLTKLLGEALQACGYTLWYWGFRVDYMADFEKHFGAVNMPRTEFYTRWCAARDVAPACAVESFLRASKAMVPHTSAAV